MRYRLRTPLIIAALSAALVAFAIGLLWFIWTYSGPAIVGEWKGTDEYGNEHYFEFHKDGKLTFWDLDRQSNDSGFTKRGPFRGIYRRRDRTSVTAESGDFISQPLGILTLVSENELKQEGGHTMRDHLVYRRSPTKRAEQGSDQRLP